MKKQCIYFAIVLLSVQLLSAQDKEAYNPTLDKVDLFRNEVGQFFRHAVDRFDQFFVDEEIEEELQRSYFRLIPSVTFREGGSIDEDFKFRASFDLPRLEHRAQLFVSTVADDLNDTLLDDFDLLLRDDDEEEVENSTITGIQYNLLTNARQHMKVSAGPKFRDGGVEAFFNIRWRYKESLGDWHFRFTQNLFYDEEEFGEESKFQFSRVLNDKSMLRLTTRALWTEISERVEFRHSLLYRHTLTEKSAASYRLSMSHTTAAPRVVDNYRISLTYRQKLKYDWASLVINPFADFKNIDDYDISPGLYIGLDLLF